MSRRNLVTVIGMLIVVIAVNNIMAQTDQGVSTVGVT
jgi:hypothetical protein